MTHLCRGFTVRCAGVLALLSCLGCEDPPSPLAPAPGAQSFSLWGHVGDTAFRSLVGSRVEVVDGPGAGTVVMTDDHGHFTLSGTITGSVRLAASKEGYLTQTKTWTPTGPVPAGPAQGSVQFHLRLPVPSADINGTYALTITADRTCTNLPVEARSRTYTAQIAPGPSIGFVATLSGARFFASAVPCPVRESDCLMNRFSLGTAGDAVGGYMTIIEQVTDTSYLIVDGAIGGSISPAGATASLSGSLDFCPIEPLQIDQGVWACWPRSGMFCHSDNHQIELIRR